MKECKKEEFYPGMYVENRVEPCEKIASSSLTLFVNQMHFPYYTRDGDSKRSSIFPSSDGKINYKVFFFFFVNEFFFSIERI